MSKFRHAIHSAESNVILAAVPGASEAMSDQLGRRIDLLPTLLGTDPVGNSRGFHLNFEAEMPDSDIANFRIALEAIAMLGAYMFSSGKVVPAMPRDQFQGLHHVSQIAYARSSKAYWNFTEEALNSFGKQIISNKRVHSNDSTNKHRFEIRYLDRGFSSVVTARQFDWFQMMVDLLQEIRKQGNLQQFADIVAPPGHKRRWHETMSVEDGWPSIVIPEFSRTSLGTSFPDFSDYLMELTIGSSFFPERGLLEMDPTRIEVIKHWRQAMRASYLGLDAGITNFGSLRHAIEPIRSRGFVDGVRPYAIACQHEAILHMLSADQRVLSRIDQMLGGIRAFYGELDGDEVQQHERAPFAGTPGQTVGQLVNLFHTRATGDALSINPDWFSVETLRDQAVFFNIADGLDAELLKVITAAVDFAGGPMPELVTKSTKAFTAFRGEENNPEMPSRRNLT